MVNTVNMSIDKQVLGRVLRLPSHKEVRDRLVEKLNEYRRRRLRYVRENHIAGYGVLIGKDKDLLDAHYKETLFAALLKDRVMKVGKVYQKIKSDFRGFIDDALFHNAFQVLSDYLNTGGSNTSGGSGFLNHKMFSELLSESNLIMLPRDPGLNRQLQRKYHEYLGRLMDHELHPDAPVDEDSLIRDTYKANIIDVLRHQGSVDIRSMGEELAEKEKGEFCYKKFMQAADVVRNYCHERGRRLIGGTGLH